MNIDTDIKYVKERIEENRKQYEDFGTYNFYNTKDMRSVSNILKELEKYKNENSNLKEQIKDLRGLNVKHLVKNLNESLQATNKSNEQLNALNDGWKAAIRDKQIQREFELQQKYKDFDKDPEWLRYQELLEGK